MGDETFDEAAFESWVAGDPRRRSAFDSMWRRVMGSEMDAALSGYTRRITSRRSTVAAGVTVLLVLAGAYAAIPMIERQVAHTQKYAVADKKVRMVMLADGTRLTLAGGAEVRVRYTRHARVVELKHGTIFADVAHDDRRPFQVDTGGSNIVDVGTSFEVSSKPGNIRVTVASGVVRFGANGWFSAPIDLTARQVAVLGRNGLNRVADVAPDAIASWRSEWAEYKGASLGRVIGDLQTLSPLPIEIADQRLSDKRVSGRIRLTDPAGQLQNLSIIYDFKIRRTDDALILSRN